VSRKYAPPFATLASVQNAGGAYARGGGGRICGTLQYVKRRQIRASMLHTT